MSMTITIVGLGLMGGSMAMALRGFRQARLIGFNRGETALREALDAGVIDEGYVINEQVAPKALRDSDLVVLCLYPQATLDFAQKYARFFKAGCVVTDLVGIKGSIIQGVRQALPPSADFVGAHPMAGREVSGFSAAQATLFNGCNYVIAADEKNRPESVELIKEMALYVGAGRITFAQAQQHDEMIAYTSQMAHVLAAAIVRSPSLFPSKGFEGGSFRDLTRVATLNDRMWSELFVLNKEALGKTLRQLIGDLTDLTELIEAGKQEEIRRELENSTRRKEEWKQWEA